MKHVYLHVPFCRRRCSYCDFSIAVRKRIPASRYVEAIQRERALRVDTGEWDEEPTETLYFGGGTPSLLPADTLAELVGSCHRPSSPGGGVAVVGHRPTSPGVGAGEGAGHRLSSPEWVVAEGEVTIEANPDDVTPTVAKQWLAAGINRASLGVQSFHPSVLAWMHRTHDAHAPRRAVEALRGAGLRALSIDLIFALPESLGHDLRRDLDAALALEPEHLSLYGLSVEPRTPLARWISRGAITPAPDERYAAEFLLAHVVLTRAGYEHYEVSNYARPGHRARHNSAYWQGAPYAGLGPAAHRFDGGHVRAWNVAPWAEYERLVMHGEDPTEERESLTPEQRALEDRYLALRTVEGVQRSQLVDWLRDAVSRGWLVLEADRVRPTPEGWLRLDELAGFLTTSAGGG